MSEFSFPIEEFLEHQENDTFTFPLHASSVGRRGLFRVKCRRLEVTDRASLAFLPEKLQNKVWQNLRSTQREIEKRQQAGMEPKDINEALANIDDQVKLADIICEAGWIEPRVTRDPAKHDPANGVIWIDKFKRADRIAYLIACNNADSEAARHFRVFRDEPHDDVPGGQDREVLERPPLRPVGDARPGIQFDDEI